MTKEKRRAALRLAGGRLTLIALLGLIVVVCFTAILLLGFISRDNTAYAAAEDGVTVTSSQSEEGNTQHAEEPYVLGENDLRVWDWKQSGDGYHSEYNGADQLGSLTSAIQLYLFVGDVQSEQARAWYTLTADDADYELVSNEKSVTKLTDAGSYTLKVTLKGELANKYAFGGTNGTQNYTEIPVVIDKAVVEAHWENTSFAYDAKEHTSKAYIYTYDPLTGSHQKSYLTVTLTNGGKAVEVGMYGVQAELTNELAKNYELEKNSKFGTLSITRAPLDVLWESISKPYDGEKIAPKAYAWIYDEETGAKTVRLDLTVTLSGGDGIAVGSYTAKAAFPAGSEHAYSYYLNTGTTNTVEITKANDIFTNAPASLGYIFIKGYDPSTMLPQLTSAQGGEVKWQYQIYKDAEKSWSEWSDTIPKDFAGAIKVKAYTEGNANYNGAEKTWDSRVYLPMGRPGSVSLPYTGKAISPYENQGYTAYGQASGTNAGRYVVTLRPTTEYVWCTVYAGGKYIASKEDYPVTWYITQAVNEWTGEAQFGEYYIMNGSAPDTSAFKAKFGTVKVEYSKNGTAWTENWSDIGSGYAGELYIRVSVPESNNYTALSKTIRVRAMQTVARPTLEQNEYTFANKEYALTVSGYTEGCGYTLTGTLKAKNAGDYSVTARLDDYYCWEGSTADSVQRDEIELTWQINKKELSVTWENLTLEYTGGALAPKASVTIYGEDGSLDTVIYLNIIMDTAVDAGTYTAKVELNAGGLPDNYYLKAGEESKTFTITKAGNEITGSLDGVKWWIMGRNPVLPHLSAKFGEVKVQYSKDGETGWTDDLGDFDGYFGKIYLRAVVEGTDNYDAAETQAAETAIYKEIAYPTLEQNHYGNTGEAITPKIVHSDKDGYTLKEDGSTTSATQDGVYYIRYELNEYYCWTGGIVGVDCELAWSIGDAALTNEWLVEPTIENWYTYGYSFDNELFKPKTPVFEAKYGNDTAIVEYSTDNLNWYETFDFEENRKYTGVVHVRITIPATEDYSELTAHIHAEVWGIAEKPYWIDGKDPVYTYSGAFIDSVYRSWRVPEPSFLYSDMFTVEYPGNSIYGTEAGEYEVVFKLNEYFIWVPDSFEDGFIRDTDDFALHYTVNKRHAVIGCDNTELVYNGKKQVPVAYMIPDGYTQKTYLKTYYDPQYSDVGKYSAYFYIDVKNYTYTNEYGAVVGAGFCTIGFDIIPRTVEAAWNGVVDKTYDGVGLLPEAHVWTFAEGGETMVKTPITVTLSGGELVGGKAVHAGTYTATATLPEELVKNYVLADPSAASVTFEIRKAENSFTQLPSIADWAQGDEPSAPVGGKLKYGEMTDLKVEYVIGGKAQDSVPADFSGELVVRITAPGTNDYGDAVAEIKAEVVMKILMEKPVLLNGGKLVYNGETQTPESLIDKNSPMYNVGYTVSWESGKTVGQYKITYTVKTGYHWKVDGGDSHEPLVLYYEIVAGTYDWAGQDIEVSADGQIGEGGVHEITYDGKTHSKDCLSVFNLPRGATWELVNTEGGELTFRNVGEHTFVLRVTLADADQWTNGTYDITLKFKVLPKEIPVTVNGNGSYTWSPDLADTLAEVQANIYGSGFVAEDGLTLSIKWAEDYTSAGSHTATVVIVGDETLAKNYTLVGETSFTYTVEKADDEFLTDPSIESWATGDEPKLPSGGETLFEGELSEIDPAWVQYSTDKQTWYGAEEFFGEFGNYAGTVYVKITLPGTDNWNGAAATIQTEIEHKILMPYPSLKNNGELAYNGLEQTPESLISDELKEYLNKGFTVTWQKGTNVGEYTITFNVIAPYHWDKGDGTDTHESITLKWRIVKGEYDWNNGENIVVTAHGTIDNDGVHEITYDGTTHGKDCLQIAGLPTGATWDVVNGTTFRNVGDYTMTIRVTLADADNYTNGTYDITLKFKVLPKEISVTVNGNGSFEWSEELLDVLKSEITVNAAGGSFVSGDALSFGLDFGGDYAKIGKHTGKVVIVGDETLSKNYTLVGAEFTYEIEKCKVNVTITGDTQFDWSSKLTEALKDGIKASTDAALAGGVTLELEWADDFAAVGSHTVKAVLKGNADIVANYELSGETEHAYTVNKAKLTVSISGKDSYEWSKDLAGELASGIKVSASAALPEGVRLEIKWDENYTEIGAHKATVMLTGDAALLANYELSGVTELLYSVTKKQVIVEWQIPEGGLYSGGKMQYPVAVVKDLNGNVIDTEVSYSGDWGRNKGYGKYTVNAVIDGAHYEVKNGGVTYSYEIEFPTLQVAVTGVSAVGSAVCLILIIAFAIGAASNRRKEKKALAAAAGNGGNGPEDNGPDGGGAPDGDPNGGSPDSGSGSDGSPNGESESQSSGNGSETAEENNAAEGAAPENGADSGSADTTDETPSEDNAGGKE